MTTDAVDLFRDADVRRWMAIQRVALVAWLAIIAACAVAGADLLIIFGVGFLVVIGIALLVDPRRPWWGARPRDVMADPEARRRYIGVMNRWLVVGFVVMLVAIFVVTFAGLAPA